MWIHVDAIIVATAHENEIHHLKEHLETKFENNIA
jgi:hypothetical protein